VSALRWVVLKWAVAGRIVDSRSQTYEAATFEEGAKALKELS
jgi:hypothetical protein